MASASWDQHLLKNKQGAYLPCVHNVALILTHREEWRHVLTYDAFAGDIVKRKVPPWLDDTVPDNAKAGDWNNDDNIRTGMWITREYNCPVSTAIVAEAVQVVAQLSTVHPVRDWLDSLKWDRKARLDDLFIRLAGAKDCLYTRAVTKNFFLGAVARVKEPGAKVDTMLILEGDQGIGKCHAAGQGILKADGTVVLVENVRVGDVLAGPDGAHRRVLSTNSGEAEMFEIRPTKGAPWRVNIDHVLTLVHSDSGEVRDISVRDYLSLPPTVQPRWLLLRAATEFKREAIDPLRLSPYLLGVILGDGSIQSSVTVTTMDPEVTAALHEAAGTFGLRLAVRAVRGRAISYTLAGVKGRANPITQALVAYGLRTAQGRGHTASDKFVPQAYKTADSWARLELLAGLMDTDGSYTGDTSRCYDYISKSRQLADDVAFLARSVGLAAYIRPCEKRCQTGGGGTYFRVTISGRVNMIPCRVARKRAAERRHRKDALRTGFTVVATGKVEPFYGFTLDGDGRYLLDDFTVTHNSTLLRVIAGEDWFLETSIDIGSKDGYQALRRKWIVEMGELDSLNRGDVSRIKQFLTAVKDSYRPSYGRGTIDFPRQCVFAGSVNPEGGGYLKDGTGARRFQPIIVTHVNMKAVREERLQLWAEAVFRYRLCEKWYLRDARILKAAAQEAEERRQTDPWEAHIVKWFEEHICKKKGVTTERILTSAIGMPKDRQTRADQIRAGQALRAIGWGKVLRGSDGVRRYFPDDT